jgi:D-3-phosphoglycerate dehydrogenase
MSQANQQIDVLISEDLDSPEIARLASAYSVAKVGALWKDPNGLKNQIRGARTILVRNQTRVTAELLSEAPQLLAVARLGVGLDNIDVAAASERGVVVIAPLEANAVSVAELTMALLLALARKVSSADRLTRAGRWERQACTGVELQGKLLAIAGFGRIGKLVAARARAFGLRLLVFDPFIPRDTPALREFQATLCPSLEQALGGADFVSVHSPLTGVTKQMFNENSLAAIKRGAFFINTSRGELVNETALVELLQNGHLAGAALDVRQVEPPVAGVLERMDNVILTPHIGAFTREAQTRTFQAVCLDLDRILRGEPATCFVNFAVPGKKARA